MTKSAINILDDANISLISNYLDTTFEIISDTFVNKITKKSEWSKAIIKDLVIVYSIKEDFVLKNVQNWAFNNGMNINKWERNFSYQSLNYRIKPTAQTELERIIGINAEKQLIRTIITEIIKETNSNILKELRKEITTFIEFQELMKCLGYEFITIYSQDTFQPHRVLITIPEYDKINEQQNNPYWKDWFRARGQNQETQEPSFLEEDGHDFH